MTRPLKQGDGALAEFLDSDRVPVSSLPLDVARATETAQLREIEQEADRFRTRANERTAQVDKRGSIGIRGTVR